MSKKYNYEYKNCDCRKRKQHHFFCKYREIADIGFVMLVVGIISVCAFFLPPQAWILLLGVVLIVCGIYLFKQ